MGEKIITESIFSGRTTIIPLADVQHVEKHWYSRDDAEKDPCRGYMIITKHTRWDMEADTWANNIYLSKEEGDKFLRAWCMYRHEYDDVNTVPSKEER